MQFRFRTLLIVLAVGPPLIAVTWFADGVVRGLILCALAIGLYAAWTAITEQFWDKPKPS